MNDNSNNVFSFLHPSNEDLESIFNNFVNRTIIQTGWNIHEDGARNDTDEEGDAIMGQGEQISADHYQPASFFPINNYIPLINTSFAEDKAKYKYVLSSKGLEQLKKEKFSIEKFKDQTDCPINQEKFIEGEEIVS